MEVGEGRSSSNDLSSAPNSDTEAVPFPPSAANALAGTHRPILGDGSSTIIAQGANNVGVANARSADSRQGASTEAKGVRKPRKKKEPQPGQPEEAPKEKKPRKPRAAPGTAATSRKKQKLDNAADHLDSKTNTPPISDEPSVRVAEPSPLASSLLNSASDFEVAKPSQSRFSIDNQMYEAPKPAITNGESRKVEPPQFTSRSAGIYDPVRSITTQRPAPTPQIVQTPPRLTHQASAAPAISSIIDPPVNSVYSTAPPAYDRLRPDGAQGENLNVTQVIAPEPPMEVDPPNDTGTRKPSLVKKASSDGPSSAPSPKPTRAKEQPPPIPQGSGLLSSALFGGAPENGGQEVGDKGPDIYLHVDLKGQNNQVINFSRLAEAKYGFAALYPRQAAQKERLARIAAAGAAIERSASSSKLGGSAESGDDDGSLDIADSDNDGDVMMSGINGGNDTGANSGTDGAAAAPKRRRRRKIEEYDQEDPFVDDTDLLFEAQAATSKDGFFVYCGPLVPEGEKPAVERADGTAAARGRGSGRGRGRGRGRGGASAGNSEVGGARSGGPGSRGGNVSRKPRITKAERALREKEKESREHMATLAAKPPGYPS